jgi:hypothetical protein
MTPVYALYADGRSAERAVRNLRAAGVPDTEITVVTGEPLENYDFSKLHTPTWMWYIASVGGFVGCALAIALTRVTQASWPIVTGGMPIAPWWPNLIIMFEMTMLGAILATVGTLIVSGRLARPISGLYDESVSDGMILVGVEHPDERAVPELERALGINGNPGNRIR